MAVDTILVVEIEDPRWWIVVAALCVADILLCGDAAMRVASVCFGRPFTGS
jgi:hypothetical protein